MSEKEMRKNCITCFYNKILFLRYNEYPCNVCSNSKEGWSEWREVVWPYDYESNWLKGLNSET